MSNNLLQTLQEASMLSEQIGNKSDIFNPALSEEILDTHIKIACAQSRILFVRKLIALIGINYLSSFDHQVHKEHVEDIYELKTDLHKITLVVQSCSPTSLVKKRVMYLSTALNNNKMQYLILEDWKQAKGKKNIGAVDFIIDLTARIFNTCSEVAKYQIEYDDRYWSALYVDSKHHCSAELTIERL
jgi:hypothetical protein